MAHAADICFADIDSDGVSRELARARMNSPVRTNDTKFGDISWSPVMMVSSQVLEAPSSNNEDFVGEQKKNDSNSQERLIYVHQVLELIILAPSFC